MDLFNVATRTKEPINDQEALHNALMQGTHSFQKGARVPVVSPDGEVGTVPSERVKTAIESGYRVETPSQRAVREYVSENKGLSGAIKVGLGQFADEAAFGIPELIFDKTKSGLEVAKKNALKDEHALANALGGVAGFGASIFTGGPLWKGGAAAGSKVSAHIAKKLGAEAGEQASKAGLKKAAAGIVGKMGGGAVEGAIVTAPHVITETALGDPRAAAETMLAGVGIGSLFGAASGLGGEFLGLGKTVADDVAKKTGEMNLSKQKLARRLAQTVTGVDENDILYYLNNYEKVNGAQSFESIKNQIDEAYDAIANSALAKKADLKAASDELEQVYKNLRTDMKSSRAPRELAIDVVTAMDSEKAVLGEMRNQADELLLKADGGISKKNILGLLDGIEKEILPEKFGDKAVGAANSVRKLRDRIKGIETPETTGGDVIPLFGDVPASMVLDTDIIDYPKIYQIIKQLDDDTRQAYGIAAGDFNAVTDRIKMVFRGKLSSWVKKDVPGYAEAMKDLSERSNVLGQMSKLFPDEVRAVNKLTQMLRKGSDYEKEVLEKFSKLTGKDFFAKSAGGIPGRKRLYHGTYSEFPSDKIKAGNGDFGKGVYLAGDEVGTYNYGDFLHKYDIDEDAILDLTNDGAKVAFKPRTKQILDNIKGVYTADLNMTTPYSDQIENLTEALRDAFPDETVGYDVWEKLKELLKPQGIKGFKFRKNNADNFVIFDPKTLKTPREYDAAGGRLGQLIREREIAEAMDRGEDLRSMLVPNLFQKKQDLAKQAADADRLLAGVAELSPKRSEGSMRNLGYKRPKIETAKAFQNLSDYAGTDFADMVRDRNLIDNFYKQSTQGSRKVNLLGSMGLAAMSAIPGGMAFGPTGAAVGAAAGAAADVYGGRILKFWLDKNPSKAGLLFVEKAMRKTAQGLDEIPGVLEKIAKPGRRARARVVATDALWRIFGDEAKKGVDVSENLEKLNDRLQEFTNDPASYQAMIERFTSPLAEGGAPAISHQLSEGALAALRYLAAASPKPPKPSSPFAPKVSWRPSDADVQAFAQKTQVAENPLMVIDALADGTLTQNHVDALKSMYPAVFAAIQEKIFDTAMAGGVELPYEARVKLSLLTELPLDDSFDSDMLVKLQSRFRGEQEREEEPEVSQFAPEKNIKLGKANLTTMQAALQ